MFWFVSGLFVLGALCGVAIRMMIFIIVLLGAATIVIAATITHGGEAILLNVVVTIVTLQVGYAAGLVLRTAVASRRRDRSAGTLGEPVPSPYSEKRH